MKKTIQAFPSGKLAYLDEETPDTPMIFDILVYFFAQAMDFCDGYWAVDGEYSIALIPMKTYVDHVLNYNIPYLKIHEFA